jgi:hypothetical protein
MLADATRRSERTGRRNRRVLYLVGLESNHRTQIADFLRTLADDLLCVDSLGDVSLTVTRESAAVVILVDSLRSIASSAFSVKAFRSEDSATAIVLAARSGSRTTHELAAMARAGLDAICLTDEASGLTSLRQTAAKYLTHMLPWEVVHAVLPKLPGDALSILSLCMRLGHRPHSAEDVATWLQWDRKTIWRKLAGARIRPVHDLLEVGRLLHAAVRFDNSAAPITVIARSLHIDASTLRRLCERETGHGPTRLRGLGAVTTTIATIGVRLGVMLGISAF